MKINKVKLHNFSSYEGNNEFDFEITDAGKNIVLIGGKNGAGKTSLFTAIKVALYGPLAYGYVGVNSHYISKIKDLINSKAFQQEVVESEVQLTLQLKIERDIRNYVITRKWDYTNQKLTEEYTVARDGKLLNDQELSYFENYLRSIIPPDLFEFFLFDGEEVGNIFSTSAYNTYVRSAVFTMCGMDVFEIIRKFTRGYVTKNNSNDDDEVYDTYESAKQQIETLETEKENLDVEVGNLTKELENIDIQLTELATAFKNAGGISRKEKKQLEDEYALAEKVKTESLTNIKLFVEGLMPFYILRDLANPIMAQLDFEEKGEIFYYVQSKLKRDAISDLLKGDVSDAKVDQLMDHLLDTFRPKGFREDMEMMFDLSKEDIGRVNGIVSSLDDFDVSAMVDMVNKRRAASERTAEINRILKNSMSEEDINEFAQRENEILKKKDDLSSILYDSQHRLEEIDRELQMQEQIRDKAMQILRDLDFPSSSPSKYFYLKKRIGKTNYYALINPESKEDNFQKELIQDDSENEMLAEEKIERAYELHVKELEDNLIERILQCKPEFFERLVVELLMKMGYGYDRSSGSVVGKSHDGGVDGIINEDKLRFYRVFITMSGITPLLQTLKELEKRGIPGRILTTDYLTFSDPKALRKLEEFSNLHVKMYVTD